MLKSIKAVLIAPSAALLALGALSASAETVTISEMTYKNNGAYTASFYVRYNLDDGSNCAVALYGNKDTGLMTNLTQNNKVQVDLTKSNFLTFKGPAECLNDGAIPDGIRVWGKIQIDGGDVVSCKKSIVLIKGKNGQRMDYHSGGTSLNNNRCKQSLN